MCVRVCVFFRAVCCMGVCRAVILLVVAPAAKADDKRLARAGHDIETNIDEELSYFVSRYLDPKDTGRISWHAVERFLRWVLLRKTLQLQVSDVTRFDVAVCAGRALAQRDGPPLLTRCPEEHVPGVRNGVRGWCDHRADQGVSCDAVGADALRAGEGARTLFTAAAQLRLIGH